MLDLSRETCQIGVHSCPKYRVVDGQAMSNVWNLAGPLSGTCVYTVFGIVLLVEPVSKRSILFEVKKGENFNHTNIEYFED